MNKKIKFFLCVLLSLSLYSNDQEKIVELIRFDSDESIKRLERSKHKIDFFKLANNFDAQVTKIYCGPATASIILNAFKIDFDNPDNKDIPEYKYYFDKDIESLKSDKWNPQFNRFSQDNLFTKNMKSKAKVWGEAKKDEKADYGFQLKQLNDLFKAHGLNSIAYPITKELTLKKMKELILPNLKLRNDFVVINYSRKTLGQKGGGHISPVGAYDEKSDSFLVMDVNINKDAWVWVKSNDLYDSMNTFDTVENRGFILIKK